MSTFKYSLNNLIQKSKRNIVFIYFMSFVFSVFLYFLVELLYSWGSSDWFDLFPETFAYRFLLAMAVTFLSSAVYFAMKFIFYNKNYFWRIFFSSFWPVIIFSVLVLFETPLQILQIFTALTDTLFCLVLLYFFYNYSWDYFPVEQKKQIRLLWVSCSGFQFFLEILYVFSFLSGLMTIGTRFFIFMICFFITGSVISFQGFEEIHKAAKHFKLSPREEEVLGLLVKGKSNNEIADILFISLSTVKTHISGIFEKTGTKNRIEAANILRKI